MREVKYLSPSSISLWDQNREEFYWRYLAEDKPARLLQTPPMAVGSSFDAYVKSELTRKLFGTTDVAGVDHSFDALFTAQVEEHIRDEARVQGAAVMELYRSSGALADLVLELQTAIEDPRFEFSVEGRIPHEKVVGGIPLLGRPDIFFRTKDVSIVDDWKVNGWYAKKPPSPAKGYLKCRNLKNGIFTYKTHKDVCPMMIKGQMIDTYFKMEDINPSWATQETIYAWVLGVEVEADYITGIDQIVGRSRVSSIRNRVSSEYQHQLLDRIADIWNRITLGHIFDGTREESDARIQMLDNYAEGYRRDQSEHKDWLEGVFRS